jgi:hypothetical protein
MVPGTGHSSADIRFLPPGISSSRQTTWLKDKAWQQLGDLMHTPLFMGSWTNPYGCPSRLSCHDFCILAPYSQGLKIIR